MHAPVIMNKVIWSAVHTAQSHDIVNDTMIVSWKGPKTSLGRAYTLHIVNDIGVRPVCTRLKLVI